MLVAQLVVGHAMWTTSLETMSVDAAAPPHVQAGRARDRPLGSGPRARGLGIDALLHGFERLLE